VLRPYTECISTPAMRLSLCGWQAACFEIGEEAVQFGVAVDAGEAVADIVGEELDLGAGDRFGVMDAVAEAVESGALGLVANGGLRAGGFAESDAAAMAGQKHVALGFRFVEFLLELLQGALQCFHLGSLVVDLFAVALGQAL
jgi:hypothetical protein